MTLDHLGIAIDSPSAAALFERLLNASPYKTETVEREGVRTIFFGDGGVAGEAPKLELLDALTPESPVGAFLARRGPGLHHLAFEVADLEAEMERVRAIGVRLLADTPKPGADGKRIVFLHPKDTAGVLIELCQSVRTPPERVDLPYAGSHLSVWRSGPEHAPPLVVLHAALGSTALETDRLIRVWERDFRVYGLDFEGHGASGDVVGDDGPRVPTWTTHVDNVQAVLDGFELSEAAIFGTSMGGSVALHVATHPSGRVSALAVHAVNVQWRPDEVAPMVDPMDPARMPAEHPRWAQRLAEVHGERWPNLARRMATFTRRLPGEWLSDEALAGLRIPVRISHGDRDRYFSLDHPVRLLRTIPGASLDVLPGVDHAIQTLDPEPFARDTAAFLLSARA